MLFLNTQRAPRHAAPYVSLATLVEVMFCAVFFGAQRCCSPCLLGCLFSMTRALACRARAQCTRCRCIGDASCALFTLLVVLIEGFACTAQMRLIIRRKRLVQLFVLNNIQRCIRGALLALCCAKTTVLGCRLSAPTTNPCWGFLGR